jgi:site-specific recombinase XerD
VPYLFRGAGHEVGPATDSVHDLRHLYATLALEPGLHPRVVRERLGHANVSIRLDICSHVDMDMQVAVAAAAATAAAAAAAAKVSAFEVANSE